MKLLKARPELYRQLNQVLSGQMPFLLLNQHSLQGHNSQELHQRHCPVSMLHVLRANSENKEASPSKSLASNYTEKVSMANRCPWRYIRLWVSNISHRSGSWSLWIDCIRQQTTCRINIKSCSNSQPHYFRHCMLFTVALRSRCRHYIFVLSFRLILSFFPCLISAVADWMSTILPHMMTP